MNNEHGASLRRYLHPVCTEGELGAGLLAATLLDEEIVLYRTAGEIVAMQDLCIHRGTRLSLGSVGEDGCIVCPYHGWTYDTAGRCVRIPSQPADNQKIPSQAKVVTYRTTCHAGLVWVALEEPELDLPSFPEYQDPSFDIIGTTSHCWQASAGRIVENLIDTSHLPFVHPGLLGSPDSPEVEPVTLDKTEGGFSFSWTRSNPEASDFGSKGELTTQTTETILPFTWKLLIESSGRATVIFVTCQPVSEEVARFWLILGGRGLDDEVAERLVEFHETVVEQDRVIVESQRPRLLPIDITMELHVRGADGPSLEYRRRLGALTGVR